MKKIYRLALLVLGSVLILFATSCKSKRPVTKYGVQTTQYDSTLIKIDEEDKC